MSDAVDKPILETTPRRERRRLGWREFRRSYPGLLITMTIAVLALLAMDWAIIARRQRYEREVLRLRESMTDLERKRMDEIVSREGNKLRVAIELMRRQARMEGTLHLSVSVDSSVMSLEREGALLRKMPVHVGPERRVGIVPDTVRLVPPRGVRSIARVMTALDAWEIPEWVYADRGVAVPVDRSVRGALGPAALLLDGGTLVYSMPHVGLLNDSGYVLPGAVRARAEDLQAILPNLTPGMRIYFY